MKRGWMVALLSVMTFSCGYHFEEEEKKDIGTISICVPFVKGDIDGEMTNALVRELSSSGSFKYTSGDARYRLQVTIVQDDRERIGFRYDREAVSGKLKDNLVPTEGRRTVGAQVVVIEEVTGKIVLGPTLVRASMDYDYVNSDNLEDLTFITPTGQRTTVLQFSLGQLDTFEAAEDNALDPLYRHVAQKIVDGLIGHKWWIHE